MITETPMNIISGYSQPGKSSEMVLSAILKMLIAFVIEYRSDINWEGNGVDGG